MLIVHVVAVDPRNATLQAALSAFPKQLGVPMTYRLQGRIHAAFHHTTVRLSSSSGQGTVEYVALILLVAGVLAALVALVRHLYFARSSWSDGNVAYMPRITDFLIASMSMAR